MVFSTPILTSLSSGIPFDPSGYTLAVKKICE